MPTNSQPSTDEFGGLLIAQPSATPSTDEFGGVSVHPSLPQGSLGSYGLLNTMLAPNDVNSSSPLAGHSLGPINTAPPPNAMFPRDLPRGTSLPGFFDKLMLSGVAGDSALTGQQGLYPQLAAQQAAQEQQFVNENTRPGVPLNLAGAPPADLSFVLSNKDINEQYDFLKNEGFNPRPSADGRHLIIQQPDANGNPQDVLLDPPHGFHPITAIASNAVPLAEGAGKMAAATLVGNPELGLAGRASIGGSALGQTGSNLLRAGVALTPGAQDLIAGQPVSRALIDTALTSAPALLAQAAPLAVRSLLSKAPDAQAQAVADAAAPAAARQGIAFSPALTTGNPTLAKSELALGGKALGAANEAALQGSQRAAQERVVGALSGPESVPTQLDVASQAKPSALPVTGQTNEDVGAAIRDAVTNRDTGAKAAFDAQTQANYNDLYQKSQDAGVAVDTTPAAKLLQDELAKIDSPIAQAISGEVNRVGKIAGQAAEGEPITVQQAVQARALARGKLDSGLTSDAENRHYGLLHDALDQSLQDAVGADSSAPQAVKDAFANANDTYAQNIPKFQAPAINKLALPPSARGGIADADIVPDVLDGGSINKLNDYKQVLRPQEYDLLRQQAGAHVINEADGNGAALASSLGKLSPELKAELYGANAQPLENHAALLAQAQTKGPSDVSAIANIFPNLEPQLQESVAQRTAQDLLDSARIEKPGLTGAKFNLDPDKLASLTTGKNRDALEAVLGPDRLQILDDLIPVAQQINRVGALQGKTAGTAADIAGQVAHGGFVGARDAALLGPGPGVARAGAKVGAGFLGARALAATTVANAQKFIPGFSDFLKSGQFSDLYNAGVQSAGALGALSSQQPAPKPVTPLAAP